MRVTSDTLRVGPPLDRELGAPYPGHRLDSAGFAFFSEAYPNAAHIDNGDGLAVLFRISLAPQRTGYVLRVPSQYDASAAELWVFNSRLSTWETPLPLADEFGDACWFFRREAWIVDVNDDGVRDVVQRERNSWVNEDSGEPGQTDSLFVSLGSANGQGAYRHSTDPRLRAHFDVKPWEPYTRGSCGLATA
jgi:hypothetical protein